jgi:hypothetical protein
VKGQERESKRVRDCEGKEIERARRVRGQEGVRGQERAREQ